MQVGCPPVLQLHGVPIVTGLVQHEQLHLFLQGIWSPANRRLLTRWPENNVQVGYNVVSLSVLFVGPTLTETDTATPRVLSRY